VSHCPHDSLDRHAGFLTLLHNRGLSNGALRAMNRQMSIGESFPVRVLMFAIVAGATSLVGFVYIPPLLRPGIPVSHFRQLPAIVASDLNGRGCNIVRGKNVISGDFTSTGERDWAVLCQQDKRASLLIYVAGSSKPVVFGTYGAGLGDDPESARGIRVVHWDYVAQHNPGIPPSDAVEACIEDGVGMGSSIYCYLNGAWAPLAGAD
jgi:hypothetical protein